MGLRHLRWDQSMPYSTSCTSLTNSLRHDTFPTFESAQRQDTSNFVGNSAISYSGNAIPIMVAQILVTRPATVHPQLRIIETSQVYCEKGSATDESTPRQNTETTM